MKSEKDIKKALETNIKKFQNIESGTMLQKNNKSGVNGVSKTQNGRWRACIQVKKKFIQIGVYENFENAVKAREIANSKYMPMLINASEEALQKLIEEMKGEIDENMSIQEVPDIAEQIRMLFSYCTTEHEINDIFEGLLFIVEKYQEERLKEIRATSNNIAIKSFLNFVKKAEQEREK